MVTIAFFDRTNGPKRAVIVHLMPIPIYFQRAGKEVHLHLANGDQFQATGHRSEKSLFLLTEKS